MRKFSRNQDLGKENEKHTWKIIRKHEIVYRTCFENDLVNDFIQSVCAERKGVIF